MDLLVQTRRALLRGLGIHLRVVQPSTCLGCLDTNSGGPTGFILDLIEILNFGTRHIPGTVKVSPKGESSDENVPF